MKLEEAAATLALVIALSACGAQSDINGTLSITENGTYDVSGYAEVVVNVGDETPAKEEGAVSDTGPLELVRAQFSRFSMEVPSVMVEGYTEAELTENDSVTLRQVIDDESSQAVLNFYTLDLHGINRTLEQLCDGPQEDVGGITMAIKHGHDFDIRSIDVAFMHEGIAFNIRLTYPVSADELYGNYADEFYRTIQLN